MPDEFQTLKKERSIEIIMNLHAWVVPKTSLRRVLYFPTANMFDFNEQTKQPIMSNIRKNVNAFQKYVKL